MEYYTKPHYEFREPVTKPEPEPSFLTHPPLKATLDLSVVNTPMTPAKSYQEMVEERLNLEREEQLRSGIATYFDNLHSGQWGKAFDISRHREPAVDFIVDLFRKISQAMTENKEIAS